MSRFWDFIARLRGRRTEFVRSISITTFGAAVVHNKLGHTILGLTVCAIGIMGFQGQWISPYLAVPFLVVAILGGVWAYLIGHAWQVIPVLLIGLPVWLCEQLDPRPPARLKRLAHRERIRAVAMRDLRYYGADLGHQFRYRIDDGILRLTDLGEQAGWCGQRIDYVFAIGDREALVYDFREDSAMWQELARQPWMYTAESGQPPQRCLAEPAAAPLPADE